MLMTQPTKHCLWCGKEFEKPPTTSVKEWEEQRKFCSTECYHAYDGRHRKAYKICAYCGEEFHTGWDHRRKYCSRECFGASCRKPLPSCEMCGEPCKKHGARFCSRECKVRWYRGEQVYNYKGGQARDHYASAFWLKRAQEIRERDKVCQHCGYVPADDEALHVHHIIPWEVSHDDSPSNLIALCPSCHKKADHEYNGNCKP